MTEKAPLNIDREALMEALRVPSIAGRANAEWCVACGAGAAAGPELPMDIQQEVAKDASLIRELLKPEFVAELATRFSTVQENADWCVACGASAAAAPELGRVASATRETLSDADIDRIAARLLGGRPSA